MSTLASVQMTSPANKTEECARFTISDSREKFTFTDVAVVGEDYTLSFWIKSAAAGSLIINGNTVQTGTSWVRHVFKFAATSKNLVIDFKAAGTYYIYHLQLEVGNMATDWTVAVEDVDEEFFNAKADAQNAQSTADNATKRVADAEALLRILEDSIQMLVTDENGSSLMVQEGNRWTFSMSPYTSALSDVSDALNRLDTELGDLDLVIDRLNGDIDDMKDVHPYMRVGSANNQPYLELGTAESTFKLRITNTEILFIDGTVIPAYLSNQKLFIEKAEVKDELRFGGFIWKKRSNGNMGIAWIGGDP